ncbi:MAG: exo-alpha-sialidase [Ruminococcaceae bacterium]|nr:exo-alpha-sialidase [Oscillospiraceae bacterium]
MDNFRITPEAIPSDGILFVNHERNRRSGHIGHAMVEYADGCILCFYSNNSGSIQGGHNGYGWVESKRSLDGGVTWSEPTVLPYSWDCFLDGQLFISCEKAVVTDDGTIVLFCLRSTLTHGWSPWEIPTVIRSFDGGYSWTEPVEVCPTKGRIYDVRYRDGKIYVLHFANDSVVTFTGNKPEHVYELYVSEDNGVTFTRRSVLSVDATGLGYGSLNFLADGRMIAWLYNIKDEYNLVYLTSEDDGLSWSKPETSYFAKRIRNPQTAYLNGLWFLHGRSGCVAPGLPMDFVLYTSTDGIHWDEGRYLRKTPDGAFGGAGYYSNNIITGLKGSGPHRLLIQTSDCYDISRTNIRHWWIDR